MKGHRISQLDALRGMAALLVMLQHLTTVLALHPEAPSFFQSYNDYFNHYLFSPGRMGVVAFFLTSGFVVPYSLSEKGSVIQFCVSRFFRLYPAYWLSLALALIVYTFVLKYSYSTTVALANITMAQGALGIKNVIPAYWTLLYELIFYVICIGLFIAGWLNNSKRVLAVVLMLTFAAAMSAVSRRFGGSSPPVGLFLFLAVMFLGVLFRISYEKTGKLFDRYSLVATVAILGAAPVINFVAYFGYPKVEDWISASTGIALGFALFVAVLRSNINYGGIILRVGVISYGVYLLHDIPMQISKLYFYGESWIVAAVLIPVITVGVTYVMATASYTLVEIPLQAIGKGARRWVMPKARKV